MSLFNEIHLEPEKVPEQLRRGYTGKKFRVRVCEEMTIPADAGTWDGGSRSVYVIKRLADGAAVTASDQMSAPWDSSRKDRKLTITPGLCVVCHTMFSGKDLGLTFYLHPADAAPMLPAPLELTPLERLILEYTAGRKSSYAGKNRYQMAKDDQRWSETKRLNPFPTEAEWEAAKPGLVSRGLLTKTGAITPAGRNAA